MSKLKIKKKDLLLYVKYLEDSGCYCISNTYKIQAITAYQNEKEQKKDLLLYIKYFSYKIQAISAYQSEKERKKKNYCCT